MLLELNQSQATEISLALSSKAQMFKDRAQYGNHDKLTVDHYNERAKALNDLMLYVDQVHRDSITKG